MILHPGVAAVFRRLDANELDIARMMAAGDLSSPQPYRHIWLFDIRITGTGVAYRAQHKEWTFRDPALYCTPDFLARCSGLPAVWEHPQKAILNAKEFRDRIVGTVFLPYLKPDEVWAIVKIWDGNAAELMATCDLSTSPGILLPADEGDKGETEGGDVMLIEADPQLVDHIAVGVPLGVWDKYGPPSGVRVDATSDPRVDHAMDCAERMTIDSMRLRYRM